MAHYKISIVTGDGIGPDLAGSALELLNKISDTGNGLKFEVIQIEAGDNAKKKYGMALPDFSFESIINSWGRNVRKM